MDGQTFEMPKKLSNYDLSSNAVGIDFGTTECCAAVIRKNGPEFIVLDPITRLRTMPSFIAFHEEKPKCGQNFDEIVVDPIWPFKIIPKNVGTYIEVDTHTGKKKFESEKVASDLLLDIKKTIESFQNQNLTDVVISIPSEITEKQKLATTMAAEYAGWKNIHFIPEPVAAAFANVDEMPIPDNSNILICDFGGGTVDICIAKVATDNLKILTYNGDSYLGGRDFDAVLFNHFASILTNKHVTNLKGVSQSVFFIFFDGRRRQTTHSSSLLFRVKTTFGYIRQHFSTLTATLPLTRNNKNFILKRKCQDIKHNLSVATESWLDVSDFDPDSEDVVQITRKEFESMTTNLIVRTKNVLLQSASKANLQNSDINIVLQVGGGCRMPMIKTLLSDIFPNANHRCSINPDWIVTHGAAVYAYYLKEEKPKSQQMIEEFETMSHTDKIQSRVTNTKIAEHHNNQSQKPEPKASNSQKQACDQTKYVSPFKPNSPLANASIALRGVYQSLKHI